MTKAGPPGLAFSFSSNSLPIFHQHSPLAQPGGPAVCFFRVIVLVAAPHFPKQQQQTQRARFSKAAQVVTCRSPACGSARPIYSKSLL